MIHVYLIVHKTFSFREHFDTVLREEIQIAKFCTEVFVMPKHLMAKLHIPEASSYMSPLHAIVKSYQYCGSTVILIKKSSFCTFTCTCNETLYTVTFSQKQNM